MGIFSLVFFIFCIMICLKTIWTLPRDILSISTAYRSGDRDEFMSTAGATLFYWIVSALFVWLVVIPVWSRVIVPLFSPA